MTPKKNEKILSCFIDETGDFGEYDARCPYYMVTAVLHDQNDSISKQLDGIEQYLLISDIHIMRYMLVRLFEEKQIMKI